MKLTEHLPVLATVTALLGAYLSPIIGWARRKMIGYWLSGITFIVLLQAIALVTRTSAEGRVAYHVGGWPPPWGIELVVTPASALVVATIAAVAFLVALYSSATLDHDVEPRAHGWYAAAYLLCFAGMIGMVVTNDLFNIFVMMEITTLGAVGLVVAKDSWGAAEAGLRYLLLASLGSTLVLFGIGLLYSITGNLNLTYLVQELASAYYSFPTIAKSGISLLLLGFGLKAALFPLHVWLPEAHSNAPTTSSAVLSGLVVKAYAFTFLRVLYQICSPMLSETAPVRSVVAIMGGLAVFGGSLFALVQVDIKRLLAYSTIAQVGYIFLGAGLGTPAGLSAAFYQIVGHAFTKACLFLSAGLIIHNTGKRKVADMAGVGRVLPLATAAFTICTLSMIGIPFLSGFAVKWYTIQASIESGRSPVIALVVLSSLLNAAYYFPIIWRFYFVSPKEPLTDNRRVIDPAAWPQPSFIERLMMRFEAPWQALVPIGVLVAAIVVLGVWTEPLLAYIARFASVWLGGALR